MRATDLAVPTVTPHVLPPGSPMAAWPGQLRIAIERVPTAGYTWDDADTRVAYDDADTDYRWDDPLIAGGYVDAVCDFQALALEAGPPDELNLFPAGTAVLTLDNRAGNWSQYAADGRLAYFAPGRHIAVWWHDDAGVDWWLGDLFVADWLEADTTVTITAVDAFAQLALPVGDGWMPGAAGQSPKVRMAAIMTAAASRATLVGDTGDITLTAQPSDLAPLEEMQVVALSDGGIVFPDADGRVRYRNRLWPAGRDDQPVDVWDLTVFSDNVCAPDIVNVWAAEFATADDRIATRVHLQNVAGLVADAVGPDLYLQRYPYTHPERDQWTTQLQGNAVAAAILAQRSNPRVAVSSFDLYLQDPNQPSVWMAAVDRRLGDRVRFLHEFVAVGGDIGVWDLIGIVGGIRHDITPETWITSLACSRSVDAVAIERWDFTPYRWDSADPHALWRA